MKFKKYNIVVLTKKQKKVGKWSFGHPPGTVGIVINLKKVPADSMFQDGEWYHIRFLTYSPTCGAPFASNEFRLATPKEVTKAIVTGLLPEIDKHCEECQNNTCDKCDEDYTPYKWP
jgi:hypothetical protein